MSGASKSQIVFARSVLRFVGYGMVLNAVLVAWAIWAFVIGMPEAWFSPSMWIALGLWVGGELILVLTILVPALRARAADQDSEKGLR